MNRKFIIAIIIAAMIGSGLPSFDPGDADHDRVVDLRDAVIKVMDLAKTAQSPGAFQRNMAGMLRALRATAGLNMAIQSADSDPHHFGFAGLDSPFFISSFHFEPLLEFDCFPDEPAHPFFSFDLLPPCPPPRVFFLS